MSWRPEGVPYRGYRKRPEIGDVVAYDRRAWKVRNVDEAEPTPEEVDRINRYVPKVRDAYRPYRVILTRIHGAKHENEKGTTGEIGLRFSVGTPALPVYPNGRVPLCSCHSEPWPCLEADQQAEAAKAMKRAEHEMRLLPGCCPGCQEPVTRRQQSIRFPGPYVRNPFLSDVVFHLRRKCRHEAARYEDEWVAADKGRSRSLLTLRCKGTLIVHHDGSAECFGADESDCPTVYAQHRAAMSCYVQTHGCGRECSVYGHPGTHVAGRPSDPRAINPQETL